MPAKSLDVIAQRARMLVGIYRDHARKYQSNRQQAEQFAAPDEILAKAQANARAHEEACLICVGWIDDLRRLVTREMKDIAPDLRFIVRRTFGGGSNYHLRENFDWDAFEKECRQVEAEVEHREETGTHLDRKRKHVRKHRRTQKRVPTAKQIEAAKIMGECDLNMTLAAKRMGCSRATFAQHYQAALRNAGQLDFRKQAKTLALKRDRRGQETAADDRRKL